MWRRRGWWWRRWGSRWPDVGVRRGPGGPPHEAESYLGKRAMPTKALRKMEARPTGIMIFQPMFMS